MSTKEFEKYFQATTAGAFAQAIEQATKSDRLARRVLRSKDRTFVALARQLCTAALRRLLLRPAWAFGMMILAIALGLGLFSD